jgi:hypothetical protein
MSHQAVEWAVKHVPPNLVGLPARAVLIAFAEHAGSDGKATWPSLPTIAWYLDCSVRNVEKHVKTLTEVGLLVRSPDQSPAAHIPADRRPVVYDMPLGLVRTDEKPDGRRRGRKPTPAHDDPNSSTQATRTTVRDLPETARTPVRKRPELQYANGPNSSTARPEPQFGETALEPLGNLQERSSSTRAPRLDAIAIVKATPAAGLPRVIKDKLAGEVAKLIDDKTPEEQIEGGLDMWCRRTDAGPGLLPWLVGEFARKQLAQAKPAEATPLGPATAKAQGWDAVGAALQTHLTSNPTHDHYALEA